MGHAKATPARVPQTQGPILGMTGKERRQEIRNDDGAAAVCSRSTLHTYT
jgi:hypothetical protein